MLAQQRPSLSSSRRQQQEGSTDFQWVPDAGRPASALHPVPAALGEPMRQPTHRIPARAPVIGAMSDLAPAAPRSSADAVPQLG